MNQDTALREAQEWAARYWAAEAEMDRLGEVVGKALIEREQLRAEVERLREALRRMVRAADEYRQAMLGEGHPGTEHDAILYGEGPRRLVDDCVLCAAAICEAGDERDVAIARARVLLGMPRQPWEEEWLYAEEPNP